MKRNKIFVLGLIAAFVAILSLTLVSGTWAKYTSTVTGSSEARVAKWAFSYDGGTSKADLTQRITFNLFDTLYDTNGSTEGDVVSTNSDKVIAPGTKGSARLSLKNTGEVNATATVTFKVTGSAELLNKLTFNGQALSADGTITLPEVNLYMNQNATNVDFNWEWPFEVGTTTEEKNTNNASDTTLGIAGSATIKVEATVVFTQIN